MMHKKMMCLLMAGIMALPMVACGGTAQKESGNEAPAEKAEVEEDAGEKEGYSEDEQVEITFWSLADGLEGGALDTAVADEIARITGVRINNVSGSDDKFQVLMASGDLPDVVYCNGTGSQSPSSLIESGQIIAMDDLVEQYGDNIKKWGADAINYSKTVLSDESQSMYFLPMNVSNNGDDAAIPSFDGYSQTFTMRWDLYAQAGYPEINSEEEYLQVLADMQEQFSETADGKTMYAMGAWSDWGTWPYRIPYTFAHGTGEGKNATIFDQMTGEIEMMYYSDNYWNAVRFYNKAYNMGLLDPESFTQTFDDYCAKASAGQYITGIGRMESKNEALQAIDPSYGFQYVPCGMNYLSGLYVSSSPFGWGSGNFALAITESNEHPEETMRLLNFLYSTEGSRLIWSGIEGEDWVYNEDGSVSYTEEYLEGVKADPENYKKNRGIGTYMCLQALNEYQIGEDGNPVNVLRTPENIAASLSQCDQDYCDYYSELYGKEIAYPGEAVAMLLEDEKYQYSFEYNGLVNELTTAVSGDASSILSEIDTMVSTDFINLIMLPEAELEDAIRAEIEKIDAAGYADLSETIQGLTEEAKERAAALQ